MKKCKSLLTTAIVFLTLQGFCQDDENRFEIGSFIATHPNYLIEEDLNERNIFGNPRPPVSFYGKYRLGELGYSTISLKLEAGMHNYVAQTSLGYSSLPATIYADFLFTNLLLNFNSEIIPNMLYFSMDIGGSSSFFVNQELFQQENELPQSDIAFAEYIKTGIVFGFFGELYIHESIVLKLGLQSTTNLLIQALEAASL